MSRVDFAAVKAHVTYNDVLRFLNLRGKRVGEQWRGRCPACNTDNDRALVLTAGRGAYCHAAKSGGDVIWLVSHVKGIGVKEAAQQLADQFGIVPQEPAPPIGGSAPTPASKESQPASEAGKTTAANVPTSLAPLTYLVHDHEAVKALGFSLEVAKRLGIGFANKGLMKGRVAIPLYEGGTLAGYVGLAPGTDAKLPKNLT